MFSWIIPFALGGYLAPAFYFFILTFEHDRKAEDHPTVFDSLTTGILSGLMWPFVNRMQDQGDTVHW